MDRKDVFEYVKKQYGTVPEYLWKESPESAVLRNIHISLLKTGNGMQC